MGVIRSGSVSIVLCLTLSVACARIANQTNNIGSPCKSEADCESGLVCYQGQTCQEPCLTGNTCKDPTKTCQNGACVAGSGQGGADGGSGQDGPKTNGSDAGGNPPGSSQSDGTVVVDGLPGGQDLRDFANDDSIIYYQKQSQGGLGETTYQIAWTAFAGQSGVIDSIASDAGSFDGPYLSNGRVYWMTTTEPQPGTTKLRRATAGNPPGVAEDAVTLGQIPAGGGMGGVTVAGDYLLFLGAGDTVRVYDAKNQTLDPTNYGATSAGGPGGVQMTVEGGKIYFLDNASPVGVWSGTLGAPATKTPRLIPKTAGLVAVGVSGNELFGVTGGGGAGTQNLVAFNVMDNTTPYRTVFALGQNAMSDPSGRNMFAYQAGYAFTRTGDQGNGTGEVVRITLADGTKMHIGSYFAQGGGRPMTVTNGSIYILENTQGQTAGSRLSKWPKP